MRSDICQHFSKALRVTNLILHVIVPLKHGIIAAGVGFHHGLTVFEMVLYAAKLEIDMRRDLSRYVFVKKCAIRVDKQQKERYKNVVINNDIII